MPVREEEACELDVWHLASVPVPAARLTTTATRSTRIFGSTHSLTIDTAVVDDLLQQICFCIEKYGIDRAYLHYRIAVVCMRRIANGGRSSLDDVLVCIKSAAFAALAGTTQIGKWPAADICHRDLVQFVSSRADHTWFPPPPTPSQIVSHRDSMSSGGGAFPLNAYRVVAPPTPSARSDNDSFAPIDLLPPLILFCVRGCDWSIGVAASPSPLSNEQQQQQSTATSSPLTDEFVMCHVFSCDNISEARNFLRVFDVLSNALTLADDLPSPARRQGDAAAPV